MRNADLNLPNEGNRAKYGDEGEGKMNHCPCPTGDPGPCCHCGSSDWTIVTKHFPHPLIVYKGIAEGNFVVRYDAYHAHCEYAANEQGKFRRTGGGRIVPQDKHTVRNRTSKADERKAKDAKRNRLEAREGLRGTNPDID